MKKNAEDAVMAEMHAIKDANSARYGHDLKRMFAHWTALVSRQSQEKKAVSRALSRRAGKSKTAQLLQKRPKRGCAPVGK